MRKIHLISAVLALFCSVQALAEESVVFEFKPVKEEFAKACYTIIEYFIER